MAYVIIRVVDMIPAARTSEDAPRALVVARASLDEDQYAWMVRLAAAMLTADVGKALDESRHPDHRIAGPPMPVPPAKTREEVAAEVFEVGAAG